MQDRPTAPELLDAAREFLETEVMPELTGRKQFHVRVTVNVLKILVREWEHEEDAVRAEWTRLAALLGRDGETPDTFADTREQVRAMNVDLAGRIRAGDLDDRWTQVLGAVTQTVDEKLRIANPGYMEQ